MKQAKLALTAVAVLAVIGGALAFKANNVQTKVFKRTTTTGSCNVPTTLSTVLIDVAGGVTLTDYNSISAPGACTGITVTLQD